MDRVVGTVLVLLMAGFAGCLVDQAQLSLEDLLGAEALEMLDDGSLLLAPSALVGRFLGENETGEWRDRPTHSVHMPRVTVPKPPAPPYGGGGERLELPFEAENVTFLVQFRQAARLVNYQARWALPTDPDAEPHPTQWSTPRAATDPIGVTLKQPGAHYVTAQLVQNETVVGRVKEPLVALVQMAWTVDSSVHPLRPPGMPELPNYEEMADRFEFRLRTPGATVRAQLSFRGPWNPTQGTDVDLELDGPDGRPVACAASAGAGGGPATLPDPEQATDHLEVEDLGAGELTMRVGAIRPGPGCSGNPSYTNAGSVPYTLDLDVEWPTQTSASRAPKPPGYTATPATTTAQAR